MNKEDLKRRIVDEIESDIKDAQRKKDEYEKKLNQYNNKIKKLKEFIEEEDDFLDKPVPKELDPQIHEMIHFLKRQPNDDTVRSDFTFEEFDQLMKDNTKISVTVKSKIAYGSMTNLRDVTYVGSNFTVVGIIKEPSSPNSFHVQMITPLNDNIDVQKYEEFLKARCSEGCQSSFDVELPNQVDHLLLEVTVLKGLVVRIEKEQHTHRMTCSETLGFGHGLNTINFSYKKI